MTTKHIYVIYISRHQIFKLSNNSYAENLTNKVRGKKQTKK